MYQKRTQKWNLGKNKFLADQFNITKGGKNEGSLTSRATSSVCIHYKGWIDIACSWNGGINTVKMTKEYYSRQTTDSIAVSVKIPMTFLTELEETNNSKIFMKVQKISVVKTIFQKQEQS